MDRRLLILAATALLSGCHGAEQSSYFTLEDGKAAPRAAALSVSDAKGVPVIQRGAPGSWEADDVLNPSVVRFKGTLLNLYSGYDGKAWHTGLATSQDGKAWVKAANNPVLSPGSGWSKSYIAANGAAIVWKDRVLYFYQGRDANGVTQIGLATSDDGLHFTDQGAPVLTPGAEHTWDGVAVGDPYVIEHNGKLVLYYLGMDEFFAQRLGVAQSTDGIRWTRFIENPVLDVGSKGAFDENGLGEPSVIYNAPNFYMLYTGRAHDERRDIGWAVSSDGVHWKKMSHQGLFGAESRAAWTSEVMCDTTMLRNDDGSVTVWFGGGDVAAPAQGLHGQIGAFTLTLPGLASSYDANTVDVDQATALLVGSWAPDGEAGSRSAWVGPHASITLRKPSGDQQLIVSGWLPYSLHAKAGNTKPVTVKVLVNGSFAATQTFQAADTFKIAVPASAVSKATNGASSIKITIETDSSFVPSKFANTADARELSMKITRIDFE